jgi:Putative Ig domain
MRRNRRGGHGGMEIGGSGEDSFVAVVVTKLTGALLFILLLTMVIMALIPKAIDLPKSSSDEAPPSAPLTIATPEDLPEAIAGRPYTLALAATGARGPVKWSVAGNLPDGLAFDSESGVVKGTPHAGTPKPVELVFRVSDGASQDAGPARLTVYQSDKPLATPSWWKPGIPPVPWRAWLEQGFGFLVLLLVHLVGMNSVGSLERWSFARMEEENADEADLASASSRFAIYRATVRLSTLLAAVALTVWLWKHHA